MINIFHNGLKKQIQGNADGGGSSTEFDFVYIQADGETTYGDLLHELKELVYEKLYGDNPDESFDWAYDSRIVFARHISGTQLGHYVDYIAVDKVFSFNGYSEYTYARHDSNYGIVTEIIGIKTTSGNYYKAYNGGSEDNTSNVVPEGTYFVYLTTGSVPAHMFEGELLRRIESEDTVAETNDPEGPLS